MGYDEVDFLLNGFADDSGGNVQRNKDVFYSPRSTADLQPDIVAFPGRPQGSPGFKKLFYVGQFHALPGSRQKKCPAFWAGHLWQF